MKNKWIIILLVSVVVFYVAYMLWTAKNAKEQDSKSLLQKIFGL
jgi:flagellar basal body-associated protein FliL